MQLVGVNMSLNLIQISWVIEHHANKFFKCHSGDLGLMVNLHLSSVLMTKKNLRL